VGRLFLIHGDPAEAEKWAAELRAAGWQVEVEALDSARAAKRIASQPPRAVLIDLSRRPSHGRQVAVHLHSRPATASVAPIFVDGDPEKVQAIHSRLQPARFTSRGDLPDLLLRLAG
jgi:CheY-like chemotaxis protein